MNESFTIQGFSASNQMLCMVEGQDIYQTDYMGNRKLLGLGLGAMAFTPQGRDLGNRAAAAALAQAKKVMERVPQDKPTEQPPGAAGDHRPPG